MNKPWPIPGTLEYDEWFKKNPPISFDAEVHFVSAGPTGLPFSFPTGQCSFELDYKGSMLICICQDVSGATHFNSSCSYTIKVELPTGAAYDVSLPVGTKVRFVRPPNITVAEGVVVGK